MKGFRVQGTGGSGSNFLRVYLGFRLLQKSQKLDHKLQHQFV